MEDIILRDYGWCKVMQRNNKYVISYDVGGIAVQMMEMDITKEQAYKAMVDQYEAEKIIREILHK